jgi:hypothetical protein
MKIQLTKRAFFLGTPLRPHGVYTAEIPDFTDKENKGVIRFTEDGQNISINKVIVKVPGKKKSDPVFTKEINENFEIVDFPERDEVFKQYTEFKTKKPREKKSPIPAGYVLREGFREFKDESEREKIGIEHCRMGKGGKICGKPVAFIRINKLLNNHIKNTQAFCVLCSITPKNGVI